MKQLGGVGSDILKYVVLQAQLSFGQHITSLAHVIYILLFVLHTFTFVFYIPQNTLFSMFLDFTEINFHNVSMF